MQKNAETLRMKTNPVRGVKAVVTGMGCICAAGASPHAAFSALESGERHLAPSTVLGTEAMAYPFFAADTTMPTVFPQGRRFSAQDTLHLAQYAAQQALDSAGLPVQAMAHMPVMVGTTAGSALHFLHDYAHSRAEQYKTAPPVPPVSLGSQPFSDKEDYFLSNLATCLVPQSDGARITLANACTSGADAIGLALDAIALGESCVLCGGADALSIVPHTGFARLMIYDTEPCRPFDGSRKGLNLGEGAAFLVLENYEHALARGAQILGYVLGYGSAADAHHFTAPHPEGRGLHRAIEEAMRGAQCTWQDMAFVNAHGTATPENDKVEGAVLRSLTENTAVPVWASKGGTGHTLGAAGALEAVLCLEALRQGRVPASMGFQEPDPAIGLSPTTESVSIQASCALSTSLGFGGGNAALVLGSAAFFDKDSTEQGERCHGMA